MNRTVAERHNPPPVDNREQENAFQAEIRGLYERLVEFLSPFGEEGDLYGTSDFGIRPDLRHRPTVKPPPAPPVREFTITILTQKFFRSDYLKALHRFLNREAPNYRIWIDQDFDPGWVQTIILTADEARIHSTNAEEATRLKQLLAAL